MRYYITRVPVYNSWRGYIATALNSIQYFYYRSATTITRPGTSSYSALRRRPSRDPARPQSSWHWPRPRHWQACTAWQVAPASGPGRQCPAVPVNQVVRVSGRGRRAPGSTGRLAQPEY
eukprot:1221590-Rhodomonas_salina.1